MCKENSRLRKQFLSERANPMRQVLQQEQRVGTIQRGGLTRGEGDKRYVNPGSLPSIISSNAGNIDHGALAGLGDDDHTQYVLRSILTTKGDIYGRSSSAVTRLGVGSDGQVLTASSAAATGLAWATPTTASPVDAQYLTLSTNATLTGERVMTAGAGLTGTDAGAGSTYTLALTTPGTLDATTTNSSSSSHTHAITAYDAPGANANRLIKTGTAGVPTLAGLDIATAGRVGLGSAKGRITFTDTTTDQIKVEDAYVGINTTPQALLHLYAQGLSVPALYIDAGTAGEIATPLAGTLRIGHWSSGGGFVEELTLNGSGEIEMKSADVAHGMTNLAEANVHALFGKRGATTGGAEWTILQEDTGSGATNIPLLIHAVAGGGTSTTKSTSGQGIINLQASVKSGSGAGSVGSDQNLLTVRNFTSTKMIVDAEGDLHLDATSNANAWDDYDDLQLLSGLRAAVLSPENGVQQRLAQFLNDARPVLERTGVATFNEDGSVFIAVKALQMLIIDAMRQMYERLDGRLSAIEAVAHV